MTSPLFHFSFPRLDRVIAGPDTLAALPSEVDRYGCRRVLIVTGRTLALSPLLDTVRRLLAGRCAGVFAGVIQHVPASAVDALLREVRDRQIDCLVSVGGGSSIDTVKAAVHAMLTDPKPPPNSEGPIHIAIPTTLSAAEYTDVAGRTDEGTRLKQALSDPRLAPRVVIADPVVTIETPDWLWAASGIRALDHAIESLYSSRHHPFSDPLAERAIAMLVEHLPPSVSRAPQAVRRAPLYGAPDDSILAHRGHCQMASWLAVFGLTNAGSGLSHMLGHQIGPRWNVAHGITSAIMLPHVMRFMAGVAPARFAPIARSLGIPFTAADPRPAALACAERTAAFIAGFGLPARLRDVGVPETELPDVAGHVCEVMNRAQVLGTAPPIVQQDVASLLTAAY